MNDLRKWFQISALGLNWFRLTLLFLDGISVQGGPASLTTLHSSLWHPLKPFEMLQKPIISLSKIYI